MFGLEGLAVPAGFALSILSALGCIVYGAINWNRGGAPEESGAGRATKRGRS